MGWGWNIGLVSLSAMRLQASSIPLRHGERLIDRAGSEASGCMRRANFFAMLAKHRLALDSECTIRCKP